MAQHYIGVYSTIEKAPMQGEFPRPLGARKRLWFVWETSDNKYQVQPLNAANLPMAEPRAVTGKEFSSRFKYEDDCLFAPTGAVHPAKQGVVDSSASLVDLFLQDQEETFAAFPASPDSGRLAADDPKLLLQWANEERRPKVKSTEPEKISFDRLVGEVDTFGGDEAASLYSGGLDGSPESAGESTQVRQLRADFVQALLLLRRGARAEGISLLEKMLGGQYEAFDDGALLFSEFGLGLRRLGFATLALAAHRRALEFAPQNERVLFNLARSCHDLGMLTEAKEYLERALVIVPDFVAAKQFLTFLAVAKDPVRG